VQVQVSTEVDRPVADVWHFYAIDHVRNHPRWDPDMHLEQVSDEPIGRGTRIKRIVTRTGTPVQGEMEVTRFEPQREMEVAIHDANMDAVGRATFEERGAGKTLLTITTEIADIEPDRADFLRRMMERSVGNMKSLMESAAE
jgi:Polyketide cyclase / dehydrase and lipid transport